MNVNKRIWEKENAVDSHVLQRDPGLIKQTLQSGERKRKNQLLFAFICVHLRT